MMVGHTERLEAVTENLANCTNPGYRRLQVNHKVFETLLRNAVGSPGTQEDGKRFDPISVDFTPGALRNTSRPTDFAINGDGNTFFVVSNQGKELYTRNGQFQIDAQGNLTNADGFPVLGQTGPITLPVDTDLASLTVDDGGTLRSHGKSLDALRLATFTDPDRLNRAGTSLFAAPDDVKPEPLPENTKVINGALESSNTTVYDEMAEIISCMRAYEACQRMVRNQDENEGRMIQQMS